MIIKNIKSFFLIIVIFALSISFVYAGEVKLTTYYPAPYGEYKKIKVTSLENSTPVTIQAFSGQTGANPLIRLNNSAGQYMMGIHTNSQYNVFIGKDAGLNNASSTGLYNTFMGWESGKQNTSGNYNTGLGTSAVSNNTTGVYNTGLGFYALKSAAGATASYNTAAGGQALTSVTTGGYNTAVGAFAGNKTNTGSNNTALGVNALYSNTTGSYNTAIGRYAGYSLNTAPTYNTAVGYAALFSNTTGSRNTAVGYTALYANTGNNNVALGNAFYRNTSGSNNTGIGYAAGYNNLTGSGNVLLGFGAGYNETGSNKLYISNSTTASPLIYGDFTTGRIGVKTSSPVTTLDVRGGAAFQGNNLYVRNTASPVGKQTWGIVISSSNGQFNLGQAADTPPASGLLSRAPFIIQPNAPSNTLFINSSGYVGIGNTTPAAKLSVRGTNGSSNQMQLVDQNNRGRALYITSNNNTLGFRRIDGANTAFLDNAGAWQNASDVSFKENIRDMSRYGLDTVMRMRPVEYKMKGGGEMQVGFIGQEMKKIVPEVVSGKDGEMTMSYGNLVAVLAKAIQDQQKEIDALKKEIAEIKK